MRERRCMSGDYISRTFPITEQEFVELDKKYGDLCQYAAWQLYKKNSKNNHTDEQADIAQDLYLALMRAGSYYKRQTYIFRCLMLCKKYAKDKKTKLAVKQLTRLWKNKTRHGANRQKFGPTQEEMLEGIKNKIVPITLHPNKQAPLILDDCFNTYCKAITWNAQKAMGKKISREKGLRQGQVSLSDFDYLANVEL